MISVVLVDVDQGIQETLAAYFQGEGYQTTCFARAADAVTFLHTATPGQMVLFDYWLLMRPETSLLPWLMKDTELLQRHHYLLMTTLSLLPLAVRTWLDGMHIGVAQKPFDLETLAVFVANASVAVPKQRRCS